MCYCNRFQMNWKRNVFLLIDEEPIRLAVTSSGGRSFTTLHMLMSPPWLRPPRWTPPLPEVLIRGGETEPSCGHHLIWRSRSGRSCVSDPQWCWTGELWAAAVGTESVLKQHLVCCIRGYLYNKGKLIFPLFLETTVLVMDSVVCFVFICG